MFSALSPGAIGFKSQTLEETIAAAQVGGYSGLELSASQVADIVDRDGTDAVIVPLREAGLRAAGWGLPIDWRSDEATWQKGLNALPRLASAASEVGARRVFTWIMPCSNDREYDENRRFHIERLAPVARILADYGCSLGLEFIGPKTLRDSQRYPFIYKMEDMLAMGAEIGGNVGLLLDCFHWYTSHATVADIEALRSGQVVYVHVNDAQAGLEPDEQLDQIRALPGETGVIDIVGFLKALETIGYDGPVVAEPFKKELADLPDDTTRSKTVGATIKQIFAAAGLNDA